MIEDKLRENAELHPDKLALLCNGESYTYGHLYQLVLDKVASMEGMRGQLIPMIATSTADFLISYFAIHLSGAVAVPLHKDIPAQKYNEYFRLLSQQTAPHDVADILYTTGTTGNAKAVMISHQAIWANAENLVHAQGFSSDLTFIINGPLNHIGSLSKVYPTIYVGGTICIIEGMKDIHKFFNAIEDAPTKVATFLVPSAIRMLITLWKKELKASADKIDFIETGAAPMAASDMKLFCELLPHSRLYNTYASTETGIISTYDYNDDECLAGCLGLPMKHSSFFITEDGHVACKGKTLMSGYWNDDEATAINIGGYKVAPTEVEDAVLAFPAVKDCVCVCAAHPVIGNVLKLFVVPRHDYDRKELIAFLKTRLETYKIPVLYEETDSIHRTFNGKIDRKAYQGEQQENISIQVLEKKK